MEQNAQARLIVAGTSYQLDRAVVISRTMPKIELKVSDLQPFEKVEIAMIEPADPKMNHGEVTVFKREGKWMLLWGRETARRAIEQGIMHLRVNLMSSQALKRCKMDSFKHPDDGKPAPAPAPLYNDEFRNAPRVIDKRLIRDSEYFNRNRSSVAEIGGYRNTSGASSGRGRMTSPQVQIKPVQRDPEMKQMLDNVEHDIKRGQQTVEPGQDRDMHQHGQVERVIQETSRTRTLRSPYGNSAASYRKPNGVK